MKSGNKHVPPKKSEITGIRRGWMGWALRLEQNLTFLREAEGFYLAGSLFPRGLPWERLPSSTTSLATKLRRIGFIAITDIILAHTSQIVAFDMSVTRQIE